MKPWLKWKRWLEKQWVHPCKRVGLLIGLFVLAFGITLGIIQLVLEDGTLTDEDPAAVAVDFYQTLWIEVSTEKAKQYVASSEKDVNRRLKWALAHSSGKIEKGPVWVASERRGIHEKVYLHRPDLNQGFELVLQQEKERWKVTDWEFDLTSDYESIKQSAPGLKWEKIETP